MPDSKLLKATAVGAGTAAGGVVHEMDLDDSIAQTIDSIIPIGGETAARTKAGFLFVAVGAVLYQYRPVAHSEKFGGFAAGLGIAMLAADFF